MKMIWAINDKLLTPSLKSAPPFKRDSFISEDWVTLSQKGFAKYFQKHFKKRECSLSSLGSGFLTVY